MFLNAALNRRRALVLGDGDGRFTQALANAFPDLLIDSVELSAGMVSQMRRRVPVSSRVRIIQGSVFEFAFAGPYDIAFTHFFLDCFDTSTATSLVRLVSAHLTEQRAIWIVSDFRQLPNGWRRLYSRAWLKIMYLFFQAATGLETGELPDYVPGFKAAGFEKCTEKVSMAGMLASEWWER
jgi:hypothetical protein